MVRHLRAALAALSIALTVGVITAGPAQACAGLVTPGGNVRLTRTGTLAAYHAGVEHYVTSFQFEGGGAEFGSIVPLPGIPSNVERGGDWTLQRLAREVNPPPAFARSDATAASAGAAEVVYETRIDALDITILKGGGKSVGDWAREHGFQLTPDAPEVLDFYARRSPIFMAARFDAAAARDRGQAQGDGTPIHLSIPVSNPWVPLRILGLGNHGDGQIDADVYLLTDQRPALLPNPGSVLGAGLVPVRNEQASSQLLADLRSDKGMEWIPDAMWFTAFHVDERTDRLRYDLAIDASGRGRPTMLAAGLRRPARPAPPTTVAPTTTAPTTTTIAPTPATVPELAFAAPISTRPAGSSRRVSDVDLGLATLGLLAAAAATTGVVRRRRSAAR
jgi:hypothetical protein